MRHSIVATIVASLVIVYATPSQAESNLFGLELRVRPLLSYAKFGSSHFEGAMGESTGTYSKKEDTFIGGFAASVVRSWGPWRGELEYAWRYRTDINGRVEYADYTATARNNLQNTSLTFNTYRSFGQSQSFKPYLMAGAGIVKHSSDTEVFYSDQMYPDEHRDNLETQLTFHGGAGVEMQLDSGWTIDAGYRYADLGKASTAPFSHGISLTTGKLTNHDVILSLRKRY